MSRKRKRRSSKKVNSRSVKKRQTIDGDEILRDWAGLPEGLVDAISTRMPVLSAISMGDACRSWGRVIAQDQDRRGLPWLMICGGEKKDSHTSRTCLSILDNTTWSLHVPDPHAYAWGSIQDWLILVKKCHLDYSKVDISFWNPFSPTTKQIPLPPTFDVNYKILLSTPPTQPDCLALLLAHFGQSLSCWAPGAQTWRRMDLPSDSFLDAVFCNGSFYFVNRDYNIITLDAHSAIQAIHSAAADSSTIDLPLQHHQVTMPHRPTWTRVRRYLVQSAGDVLLVCRLFHPLTADAAPSRVTHSFQLFKLDAPRMLWIKLDSLGDRSLFLGKFSTSFSASQLGDDAANRIYFLNDGFSPNKTNEWDPRSPAVAAAAAAAQPSTHCHWGAFSFHTNSFIPNSSHTADIRSSPPIWITAPLSYYYPPNNNPR